MCSTSRHFGYLRLITPSIQMGIDAHRHLDEVARVVNRFVKGAVMTINLPPSRGGATATFACRSTSCEPMKVRAIECA
ncbi:MAG: hypothetical protein WKF84_14195 [Pyrinomonadaceae bacterium]